MSLLNQKPPVDTFIQSGKSFIASPNPAAGIDFDDAIVAVKRHVLLTLSDERIASELTTLGRHLRNQDMTALTALFDDLVTHLKAI